jgi:RNA-directed DNA polymerase
VPRRSGLGLEDIAELDTLTAAFWQAARRSREHAEVARFRGALDAELRRLRSDILAQRSPENRWTELAVFDPKPRRIHAPCFRDRVLHHALMAHMAPVLERALVADTFACRAGLGALAAVRRAQAHARAYGWFVKIDVRAYFARVDHGILLGLIARRFKHPALLGLVERIVRGAPCSAAAHGRGLPIGALTSQHFANTYLDGLDRHLLEQLRVGGMVRYMDDVLWWCDDRAFARATLASVVTYLAEARRLEVKANARIGRSRDGVGFLGFRVLPGALRLSLRRRRRYRAARARWERLWEAGTIDARGLQRGHDSALAITAHADAVRWRAAELVRRPPLDT